MDTIDQLPSFEVASPALSFKLLAGEVLCHHGNSVDGLVALTNYRLYIQILDNHHHVPLGLIEVVEHRELFYLHVSCKDARTYRCTFENNENCLEWFDRISKAAEPPRQLDQIFAFYHHLYAKDTQGEKLEEKTRNYGFDEDKFKKEMKRLQIEGDTWRISVANKDYKLCPTYPPFLIVPSSIPDIMLDAVAKFRSSRRVPAVVWRHAGNGAVIARCSQPEVGWLGWRSSEDEAMIKALSEACSYKEQDRHSDSATLLSHSPGSMHSEDLLQITPKMDTKERKVLIMDARSYTTAVANRARGGGCECPEYYPNCEIQFMNLANIHSIRKSFHALRLLCTSSADQPSWFSQLENTRWLQHMSGLIKAAVTLVNAVEGQARPVLVHCSDGWDRTPQIVALAELLLDPYYRTIEGFQTLVEREWLAFGHKFADRCGHSTGSDDQNERCPVFLQWLDCVHQLVNQFPCAFEFSRTYLVKLAQHIYSNLYGTFLCNTLQEREKQVNSKTFSVWEFINSSCFKNHLYASPVNSLGYKVLWPQCNVRDLQLWSEVYLGSWEANFSMESGSGSCPGPPESSPQHMTKTRSYGDLLNAAEVCPSQFRRCSDPSINIDKKLTVLTSDVPQESSTAQDSMVNGHADAIIIAPLQPTPPIIPQISNGVFFYDGDLETDAECNRDCIYNGNTTPTCYDLSPPTIFAMDNGNCSLSDNHDHETLGGSDDKSPDGVFLHDYVINGDKTENTEIVKNSNDCEIRNGTMVNNYRHCYDVSSNIANAINNSDADSDECTEKSESKSENTICELNVERSIETSTDTLVSDMPNVSSSPFDVNGFEKVHSPVDEIESSDGCKVCAQNLKIVNNAPSNHYARDTARTSRYSSSPLCSRTSSCSGWDNSFVNGLHQQKTWHRHSYNLGDDGLVPIRCVTQERLWQIIEEHQRKEEQLEKELHTYRQALIKQFCHKCSNNDTEKIDDASDDNETTDSSTCSRAKSKSCSPQQKVLSPVPKPGSVGESIGSAGEGQASVVESLRSDLSWEALEENGWPDCPPATLWVPDHAVTKCTGCQTEFWVGKRKHHCRKCGKIFCASCSENSTPLPSEQLYNPVRVCTWCFTKLRRDRHDVVPDQCKQSNGQPTNSNPQITASSN